MASSVCTNILLQLLLVISLFHFCLAARRLVESGETQNTLLFQYHNSPLTIGQISINMIWYGKFKPSQRAIISDFITSLSTSNPTTAQPSVSKWWKTTEKYYHLVSTKKPSALVLSLVTQMVDESYYLGKSLSNKQIVELASKGGQKNAINVVLTSADVTVEGFCSSKCGTHGSSKGASVKGKTYRFAYIWVGNYETQCPGQCAWPFHQPIYGPPSPPLVAPNNDVGLDINLASLLAGTATNPCGNGYFQGPKEAPAAPLEAASACRAVYGKGAYPGYAGDLLSDPTTGASYKENGIRNLRVPSSSITTGASSSMAAQTFPSSSKPSCWDHDVFLSFRGEDTRKSFTDHLYSALTRVGIHTFRDDDKLFRGESISVGLVNAIRRSRISLVVFSKGYASSRWCLDELVAILNYKKTIGHTLLPIFYHVSPSDVRNQKGDFFEAFVTHEEVFQADMQRVHGWRAALTEAADYSGWDINSFANGYEANFIEKIVEEVSSKVRPAGQYVAEQLVGIEHSVVDLMEVVFY